MLAWVPPRWGKASNDERPRPLPSPPLAARQDRDGGRRRPAALAGAAVPAAGVVHAGGQSVSAPRILPRRTSVSWIE